MSTMQETIARLRELDQEASPAPWIAEPQQAGEGDVATDLRLIAAARNALPTLLDHIEKLEAHIKSAKASAWDEALEYAFPYREIPADEYRIYLNAKENNPYKEKN